MDILPRLVSIRNQVLRRQNPQLVHGTPLYRACGPPKYTAALSVMVGSETEDLPRATGSGIATFGRVRPA